MTKETEATIEIPEVEGYLSQREGSYLYSLARQYTHLGCIVEIGSFKGKSTVFLAKGCESVAAGHVFAVDPHTPDGINEAAFRENLRRADIESFVSPLVMSSIEAVQGWNKSIALLWVDGDHKYRGVRGDFFAWFPHVKVGGVIAFHDTLNRKAVARFVKRHIHRLERAGALTILQQVDEILAIKKVREFGLLDRLKRFWIVRREYFRRNFALARYATNKGKELLRAGETQQARECFKLAFTYYPMHWKNLSRWIVSYSPLLQQLLRVNRRKRVLGEK
jgi:predicted O-methyltransferase YrrM